MTVRTLTTLEVRVMRALGESRQRWVKSIELAEDLAEPISPVVGALNALRRKELQLVTTSHHGMETRYALTGLGEAELGRLDAERER